MARDVLLLLLVLGVVLHLALLSAVALSHAHRSAGLSVGDADRRPGVRRGSYGTMTIAPPAPRMRRQARVAEPIIRAIPAAAVTTAQLPAPIPASAPASVEPVIPAAPPAMPNVEDTEALEPDAPKPSVQPPPAVPVMPDRPPARRTADGRPRRFTIPDLEEDHDRTGRAIAAFLGEPVPTGPGRPHRRQHRARRMAGAPAPRLDLVLAIGEPTPPSRVGRAVAAALRDIARESDEIVELPGGRLRVSLETDDAGGEAFVQRARMAVRPWLALLDARLELRVEQAEASPSGRSPALG